MPKSVLLISTLLSAATVSDFTFALETTTSTSTLKSSPNSDQNEQKQANNKSTHSFETPSNVDYNYLQHGTDWTDIGTCGVQTTIQAPMNYSGATPFTWPSFSFLPTFDAATIDVTQQGFANDSLVYLVNVESEGQLGGFYAAEQSRSPAGSQPYWQVEQLRFHYPSEHQIQGANTDLEMQIFAKDLYGQSLYCKSGYAAISFFFNVSTDETYTNDFFNFLSDPTSPIDLGQVWTKETGLNATVREYIGNDSMPPCDPNFCWYLVEDSPSTQTLAQSQLDLLKLAGQDWNNRDLNLGKTTGLTYYNAPGIFYEAPTASEL